MDTQLPYIRQREPGYDLLRVWAMLAVVSIHVLMVYRVAGAPTSTVSVVDRLLHFAVPVFFFVSGALVWGGYTRRSRTDYGRFLRRRATTVAAPYLAWSALYLTIAGARGNWAYWISHTPLLLLTGRTWYHLYFVPVLLLFYLITPLAAPAVRRWPELSVLAAYVVGLTFLAPATALAGRLGGPMLVTFTTASMVHVGNMALGAWFARRRERVVPHLRTVWPALVALGTALLVGNMIGSLAMIAGPMLAGLVAPVGMAMLVLGLAGLAFRLRLSPTAASRVAQLAELSFGVYLVHPALILVWRTGIVALGGSSWWDSAWFAVASIGVVTAGSLSITALLGRGRATRWLIGVGAPGSRRP